MEHSKLPWARCAVDGGWDGIMDADGHILFNVVANIPENCDLVTEACNQHDALKAKEALLGEAIDLLKLAKCHIQTPCIYEGCTYDKIITLLSKYKELK